MVGEVVVWCRVGRGGVVVNVLEFEWLFDFEWGCFVSDVVRSFLFERVLIRDVKGVFSLVRLWVRRWWV